MAKDDARRQKKLEKKRAKRKEAHKHDRTREKHRDRREHQRLSDAFSTTAYCWPTLFRSLFFDTKPELIDRLDFTGADLHLELFPSQEARRANVGGEVVTALRIESCEQRTGADVPPGETHIDCTGTLTEQVSKSSIYGSWYRKQYGARVDVADDEEFQIVPVTFTLQLARMNTGRAQAASRMMQSLGYLPFTPKAWNVIHVMIPQEDRMERNALETERLEELLFMLRIWTPILTLEEFEPPRVRAVLEADLEQLEAEERRAAEALAPLSAETERRRLEAEQIALEIARRSDEVSALKTAFETADAAFKAAENDPEQSRHLRGEMTTTRDRWIGAKLPFERWEIQQIALLDRLGREFVVQMQREFTAANAFTKPFLHWQRVWTYLNLGR